MCGIVGTMNIKYAAVIERKMLHALQNRGRDGCGISTIEVIGEEYHFHCRKFSGTVASNFSGEVLDSLPGKEGVAHTRYATAAGSGGSENLQPLFFHVDDPPVVKVHNGNFTNPRELEHTELKGTPFNTRSDTERFLRLVLREHRNEPSLSKSIAIALAKMQGSCSALLHTPGMLFAIRDGSGNRPLFWAKRKNGYVVASETCALDAVDVLSWQEVPPGTVMCFSADHGIEVHELPKMEFRKHCVFEHLYFSFPTSELDGRPVNQFRFEAGRKMAELHPQKTDLIIGIPDSAVEMADGYATRFRNGPADRGVIMRRHDTGRTFILSGQKLRKKAVSEKFSFNTSLIRGKSIVLVDDSLVRGTTSRGITKALIKRGAKAVHWRIPSPPIIESCFYGINTANKDRLLAVGATLDEMRKAIAADTLEFMDLPDFKQVVATHGMDPKHGCYTCMDGIPWH